MRILLVEDDEALCAAVAPLLEQEGYRVDVCRDGDDAWPAAPLLWRSPAAPAAGILLWTWAHWC